MSFFYILVISEVIILTKTVIQQNQSCSHASHVRVKIIIFSWLQLESLDTISLAFSLPGDYFPSHQLNHSVVKRAEPR